MNSTMGRRKTFIYEPPLFRTHKTNMPNKYSIPEDLKVFLGSVKSEILDPRNRNQIKCNLPDSELHALQELQRLQKERQIVVKACDKGAGIIIMNFNDYLQVCYEHLTSKQTNEQSYYSTGSDWDIEKAIRKINVTLKEGLENGYIDKSEYIAMNADNKKPGRLYCNFKEHEHLPPPRPIISGSGSITENVEIFCRTSY